MSEGRSHERAEVEAAFVGMRRGVATRRGAAIAFLLCAGLVSLLFWAASLRKVNLALRAGNEKAATKEAKSLARIVSLVPTERKMAASLDLWASKGRGRRAAVIETPVAGKRADGIIEPFLVHYTRPCLEPGPLSSASGSGRAMEAKRIFDLGIPLLVSGKPSVAWSSKAGSKEQMVAGAPLVSLAAFAGRQSRFALLLWMDPLVSGFSWPVGSFLLCLLVPALFLFVWLWKAEERKRWAGVAAAAGIFLAGLVVWLSGVFHQASLLEKGASLSGAGSVFSEGGSNLLGSGWVPALGLIALLFCSTILALGWRGIGKRMASAARSHRIAYLYVMPAAAGMLLLVLIPFLMGLLLGFFNHCEGRFDFVGLSNFKEILSGGGAPLTHPLNFYFTLGVTLLWTSVNVFLHLAIGLGLALLLRDPALKLKGIYRVLLIIPWAVPNYITALMWKGMFHQQFGAVNQILAFLGMSPVSWFSSFWTAFSANVITNTWLGFPFMMVVCLGALQSIPADLYEAAEVDGAGRWKSFVHITLPLLRPALVPAVVLGSIWTFNMFNIIYLVSAGEPGGSTDILITEAYRWAFIRYERYGLAAAYATLIFVILLLYTYLTNKATKAAKEGSG